MYKKEKAPRRGETPRKGTRREASEVPSSRPENGRSPEKKSLPKNCIKALCPSAGKCGSCRYLDVSYEETLKIKQSRLIRLLGDYGFVENILGMKDPFHYRNKVHAVYGLDRRGNILAGTYEEKSHRIVSLEKCLIEDKPSREILLTIRDLLKSFKILPYNEDSGRGLFRHALIRRGFATGQILVVLVTASPVFPGKKNFVKALLDRHPEITSIVQNINDRDTSLVLGERENVWYGKGFITDTLCGHSFRISSGSFYQVNPVQTEKLYRLAIDLADLTGRERVLDAYCGIGTIGITAADKSKEIVGVELNPEAVKDALANIRANDISYMEVYAGDAGDHMMRMAEEGISYDVVFMDPPRSGSSRPFLEALVKTGPKKIVYISCGPESLARDLAYLTTQGYQVKTIRPVDMFPFTEHVETVCLLSKLSGAKNTIDVKVDMDELDVTSAETKATYEEIKAYVLEQTGLQVSNLYIAQVKRECGIIERENYNNPKSEESRQPQCPEEKRKAIMEALKHFGMV